MGKRLIGIGMIVSGCVLWTLTMKHPVDAGSASMDASQSTGADYANLYLPINARIVPAFSGKRFNVVQFGGVSRVFYEGLLSPSQVDPVQQRILQSAPFGPDVKGSPISGEVVRQVRWLKKQAGRGKALFISTDGMEDGIFPKSLLPAGSAVGITAAILYPRIPDPKVAEMLRIAGAQVTVARSPAEAATTTLNVLTGTTPLTRAAHAGAYPIALLGGLLVLLSFRRKRSEEERSEQEEEPAEGEETVVPEPVRPSILTPAKVFLSVEVVGHPEVKVRRRLVCKQGSLIIARQGAPLADLSLPMKILGAATEVAVEVQPVDTRRLQIVNRGEVPVVSGSHCLEPSETMLIRAEEGLRLGPRVRVAFTLEPYVEGA